MKYSSILAFGCLGLASLSAHAMGGFTPISPVTCSAPTLAQCKSPSYNSSTCGKKAENISACKSLLDADMKANAVLGKQIYEPADVRESSLENGRAQGYTFSPITTGVVTPSARPGTPLLTSAQKLNLQAFQQAAAADTWMGLEAAARLKAAQKSSNPYGELLPPQLWKRNTSWDSGDTSFTPVPIASCEEFVYEGWYGYQRFLDAANRCRNDAACIEEVAHYKFLQDGTATKLAGYGLEAMFDKRGFYKIPKGIPSMTAAALKKNLFTDTLFASFLAPKVLDLFPAQKAALTSARTFMANGADHYWIGASNPSSGSHTPAEKFPTEWAWHAALSQEVSGIPVAEREANQRRLKALEDAWARWESAYYRYKNAGKIHTEIVAMREPRLGDMVEHQIFEYTAGNVLGPVSISGVTSSAILAPAQTLIGALSGAFEAGSINTSLQPGATLLQGPGGQSTPAPDPWAGVLFGYNTTGAEIQALWALAPPKVKVGSPTPRLDCSPYSESSPFPPDGFKSKETNLMLASTCELTNTLLDEWARKNAGETSCLDGDYAGCDWSPEVFAGRFANTQYFTYEREMDYQLCNDWAPESWSDIPNASRISPDGLRKWLNQKKAQAEALVDSLPKLGTAKDHFGESLNKGEWWGNNEFGAGWKASIIWDAKPIRYPTGTHLTVDPSSDLIEGHVCKLDMSAGADFDLDVVVFGGKLSIVDAGAHASVSEREMPHVPANQPNPKINLLHYDAHLAILGTELLDDYDSNKDDFADGTKHPGGIYEDIDLTINYSERLFELSNKIESPKYTATFSVGPVPVNLSAWAEFYYGATLDLEAKSVAGSCDGPGTPGFIAPLSGQSGPQVSDWITAQAHFTPYAGVNGNVTASAGITGLAEVGIKIGLTLIDARLPITGGAKAGLLVDPKEPDKNKIVPALQFDTKAELNLSTLDGYLKLYFSVLFVPAEFTVFEWKGFHHTIPLYQSPSVILPLDILDAL